MRLAIAVVTCTFAVEIVIMDLAPEWARGLSSSERAIGDAAILCLLMIPVLYLTVYKPLRSTIGELRQALGHMMLTGEIVAKTAEGIVITDAGGRILYVNDSFSQITGYTSAEAVGRRTSLLKSGLHDDGFYKDMWSSLLSEGEWQGEIWNRKKTGEIYLESLSITRVRSETTKQVHFVAIFTQAHHDRLTGLANRHLFLSKLAGALQASARTGGPVAVLFLDLDGFKAVNDEFGHTVGDDTLREIAQILMKHSRGINVVSRYGGDEFAVLLVETSKAGARLYADRIREVVAKYPFSHGKIVTSSFGVASLPDDEAGTAEDLFRAADEALYAAKRAGKNQVAATPSPHRVP
jgi:diguanylate cyclase (GGDEF)-like protein/PAS domain S-box-containing protein